MTTDPTADASYVREEIARQPDAWTRAVGLAPDLAGVLPRAGESVAVIGCGTSWFMAAAYAALREGAGPGPTDAFAASELPAGRTYDRVVAISRSGTTTEVVRAVETVRARRSSRSPPSPAPRSPRPRPTRWCSTSPTSGRWSRPSSPPPR